MGCIPNTRSALPHCTPNQYWHGAPGIMVQPRWHIGPITLPPLTESTHNTCSGSTDTTANGAPSIPRLVTAVDPRLSETCATTVRLKSPAALPGGKWVSRALDDEPAEESIVTQCSLCFGVRRCAMGNVFVRKGGKPRFKGPLHLVLRHSMACSRAAILVWSFT